MAEPILELGQQQQWEAVPPYQLLERSNIDPSGPPSLLWSPWLELGAAIVRYQSSNSVLIQNLSVVLPANKL